MNLLDPREPISTWTHGGWMLLALAGLPLLWGRAAGRAHRPSLALYGLSLATCLGLSALYHGARTDADRLEWFRRLDHMGIYVLIAGTYTPVAWNLLAGAWRDWTLRLAWLGAFGGIGMHLAARDLPNWAETGLYLALGWGSLFVYVEIARQHSFRALRLLLLGGVLYSVGAVLNELHWPEPWPGTLGAHELFHLFVMAASLSHFAFMLAVVIPRSSWASRPAAARPAPRPRPRRPRLWTAPAPPR